MTALPSSTPRVPEPPRDPDLRHVGAALLRAARQAQQLAQRTGTPCYIWRDGRVVNIGAPVRQAGSAAG